jgi:hypothetical protein
LDLGFESAFAAMESAKARIARLVEDLKPARPWEADPQSSRQKAEQKPGLEISGNEATVDGKTYVLEDRQAAFIRALAEAGPGVWVAGREMGVMAQPHPERIFAKLPEAIRAKIESKPGAGYRLRPSKLV